MTPDEQFWKGIEDTGLAIESPDGGRHWRWCFVGEPWHPAYLSRLGALGGAIRWMIASIGELRAFAKQERAYADRWAWIDTMSLNLADAVEAYHLASRAAEVDAARKPELAAAAYQLGATLGAYRRARKEVPSGTTETNAR